MTQLHFDAPINSLSFGNVSFNFLREFWKKGVSVSFFPQGNTANFEAFDKADPKLLEWIQKSAYERYQTLDKKNPTLKLWHLNGGEQRVAPKQFLYTFYECDSPTQEEINIVKSQEHVFFSSSESCNHFKERGCDNVSFVPLGFDQDFCKTNKKYLGEKVIHFGLIGKFEKRKNTQAIIQTWLSKFGNNPEFQLTCLVNNPFFSSEDYSQIINQTLGGQRWTNLNLLPALKTNSEVNEVLNAIDIDLSGCNFNEGWNLPSFNSACLGNICIVGQGMAHKDWAEGENIIKLYPDGKEKCYDGVFFREGLPFSQGNFYTTNVNAIGEKMDEAIIQLQNHRKKYERIDLIEKFSYEKSIEQILGRML